MSIALYQRPEGFAPHFRPSESSPRVRATTPLLRKKLRKMDLFLLSSPFPPSKAWPYVKICGTNKSFVFSVTRPLVRIFLQSRHGALCQFFWGPCAKRYSKTQLWTLHLRSPTDHLTSVNLPLSIDKTTPRPPPPNIFWYVTDKIPSLLHINMLFFSVSYINIHWLYFLYVMPNVCSFKTNLWQTQTSGCTWSETHLWPTDFWMHLVWYSPIIDRLLNALGLILTYDRQTSGFPWSNTHLR